MNFVSQATGLKVTFGDDVPKAMQQLKMDFTTVEPPRVGQTLPRVLHRIGLEAMISDGGLVIRRVGTEGVPAISKHDDAEAVRKGLESPLSFELVGIPLAEVVVLFGHLGQIDFEIEPGINTKMLVNFDPKGAEPTLLEALDLILPEFGLETHVALGRVLIRPVGGKLTKAHQQLGIETEADFQDVPIKDIAEYFSKLHDVPVTLDKEVYRDHPITYASKGGLLHRTLADMLSPHGLRAVVRDGGIRIQTYVP